MITGKEEQKYSERNLSHCIFVHHKSYINCPEIEPGPLHEKPVTNHLSYGMAESNINKIFFLSF
jgi:hypothetical protein